MTTTNRPSLLEPTSMAIAFAARGGRLAPVLQRYASAPHVFVVDGETTTTVTVHKTATADIEVRIDREQHCFAAALRDLTTGASTPLVLPGVARDVDTLLADLAAFLAAIVDRAPPRFARSA